MPADRLTAAPADHHADAVEAILAGSAPTIVAARHNLDPDDLAEALILYRTAGRAALTHRAESDWYQIRAEIADWTAADHIGAYHIGPALDDLRAKGTLSQWWFLRKHPCWRLRLHNADTAAVNNTLDRLVSEHHLARWRPSLYEPETAAFGGPAAITIVHDLFCADSHGILNHLRHPAPGLGRREMTLLLLNGLLEGAGLDGFERGDVFARTARHRPPPTATAQLTRLIDQVRVLLSLPDIAAGPLFTTGGPAEHHAPWLGAFHDAGKRLGAACAHGHLQRGLRAILTQIVIFHWNRADLSAANQGILATAAAQAFLPTN